jgi:formate hydrogenlyase subunit 3/multisubunit Na+/H+ antiporter MnhD subunit
MMWLAATLLLPLAMLLACLSSRLRYRMSNWLAVAAVPGLGAALFAPEASLDLPPVLLRLRLSLDTPSSIMLGVAALLWIAAGVYAAAWLRDDERRGRIAEWWLLTLTGSLGVFMAADLVSFYLLFSMVSLAAYGLIIEGRAADAQKVGLIYVALAVFGEALLLMAFVMLAQSAPGSGLLIRDAVAALPTSPWRDAILALIIGGFGVKLGMVPFHVWMPITYRTAPIPAAAVLSGAAVKAGVIGLLRFLPLGLALPDWGSVLTTLGFVSAFYGVLIGVTQTNPRMVLAFSSISQMGVITAVFGMGLGTPHADLVLIVAFYAAHHTLVKGGLFLGVGLVPLSGPRRIWLVLVPAAIMGLGLAGLPLTGGALAKLAIKPVLGDGWAATLGTLSSVATALLMTHFLFRVAALPAAVTPAALPGRLRWSWLIVAAASVVVPWALYLTVMSGSVAYALSPVSLWASLWPVVLGGALAAVLRHWGGCLPRVPDGDIVMLVAARVGRVAVRTGAGLEWLDGALRQWPVAVVSLLVVSVILAALMLARV